MLSFRRLRVMILTSLLLLSIKVYAAPVGRPSSFSSETNIVVVPHHGAITDLLWSPDGSRIVSASNEKNLMVWDAASGKLLYAVPVDGDAGEITFSPSGDQLAGGVIHYLKPDSTDPNLWIAKSWIQFWDAKTFAPTKRITLPDVDGRTDITSLAWSPNGKWIVAGVSTYAITPPRKYPNLTSKILFISYPSGNIHTYAPKGYSRGVTSITFTQDDTLMACGTAEGRILLVDPQTQSVIKTIDSEASDRSPISYLHFMKDNKTLLVDRANRQAVTLDTSTGTYGTDYPRSQQACLSSDGNTLIMTLPGAITLQPLPSGTPKKIIVYSGGSTCVAPSPNGNELACGDGLGVVRMINMVSDVPIRPTDIRNAARLCVILRAKLNPVAKWVWDHMSLDNRDNIRQFDFNNPIPPSLLQSLTDDLNKILHMDDFYNPDRFASVKMQDEITEEIKQADTPEEKVGLNRELMEDAFAPYIASNWIRWTTPVFPEPAYSISVAKSAPLAALGGSDGTLRIINLKTGELKEAFGSGAPIMHTLFAPNGNMAAGCNRSNILQLWDVSADLPLYVYKGHKGAITGMAISPDGRYIASSSMDKTVRFWRSDTTEDISQLPVQNEPVLAVAISSQSVVGIIEGNRNQTQAETWDRISNQLLHTFSLKTGVGNNLIFSPNGKMMATWSSYSAGGVHVWDVSTGQLVRTIGPKDVITAVAFTPDGQGILLSKRMNPFFGPEYGWVTWINIGAGAVKRTWIAQRRTVLAMHFAQNGTMLITAGEDNEVRLWSWPAGKLELTMAFPEFYDHLSRDEWIAWAPDGHYACSQGTEEAVHFRTGSKALPPDRYPGYHQSTLLVSDETVTERK